jgi:hypothetical protein
MCNFKFTHMFTVSACSTRHEILFSTGVGFTWRADVIPIVLDPTSNWLPGQSLPLDKIFSVVCKVRNGLSTSARAK